LWRKLPIHAALKMGKYKDSTYLDLIRILLQTFPECAKFGDENGDLPLHIAAGCRNVSSPHLISLVMSCYPDALTRKNKRGMLPLHRAYAGGVPDAVLQIIYNGYPLAAQVQDNKNKLPIQYQKSRK